MTVSATLIMAIGACVLATLFGWLGARAPDPMRGPRMVPWRFLMVLSAAAALLLLVHLANLLGMHTGGPQPDLPPRR